MTARVAVEKGRSLRDYSTDPAFRPGQRGSDGNPYWRTAMWDGTTMCHAFLAAGSALEELEAPHSGGGDVHSCVFAEVLVSASSLVFEPARESTRWPLIRKARLPDDGFEAAVDEYRHGCAGSRL